LRFGLSSTWQITFGAAQLHEEQAQGVKERKQGEPPVCCVCFHCREHSARGSRLNWETH
jgi:hypothetical protein